MASQNSSSFALKKQSSKEKVQRDFFFTVAEARQEWRKWVGWEVERRVKQREEDQDRSVDACKEIRLVRRKVAGSARGRSSGLKMDRKVKEV